jgi:hypothetical protein
MKNRTQTNSYRFAGNDHQQNVVPIHQKTKQGVALYRCSEERNPMKRRPPIKQLDK